MKIFFEWCFFLIVVMFFPVMFGIAIYIQIYGPPMSEKDKKAMEEQFIYTQIMKSYQRK